MNAIASTMPARPTTAAGITCALAALAGLMFGLDIGVISGATHFIQAEFHVTDHVIEWIVSSMMFGAAVGAALAGWMSVSLGRKRSLILGAALFVAGSLLCGAAWSPQSLIVARVLLGLAIGISAFTAPLYLAEVAPEDTRGAMISLYQLMITIGILVAFLSDTAFSYSGNWRWMLGIIAIPGALFLLSLFLLPESPRWLIMSNRKDEALAVLQRLRN
jgi:SP family galactose:H+ symporter-like MFS transporter